MAVDQSKPIEGAALPAKNGNSKRKQIVPIADTPAPTSEIAWLQTIERLAPVVGIEGVRELMTMRREEQARLAEREFNASMAAAQAELEPVVKNVMNDQTKKRYADLAAMAKAAMPIIHAHGFSATTSEFQSQKPDHLGVALEVGHRAGHSKRYEFNIPFDGAGLKGNANKTPTHAYGSTLTYGERYGKCKVFGIATEDDDGNAAGNSGAAITAEQAAVINAKIEELGADTEKFCAYLNVERVADIPAKQYEGALIVLDAKRRAKK